MLIPDDINNSSSVPVDDQTQTPILGGEHNTMSTTIIDDGGEGKVGGTAQDLEAQIDNLEAEHEVGANVTVGDTTQGRPLDIAADTDAAEGDRLAHDD